MITEKMEDALNGQLNAELYSAYLYMSMNAYFKSVNLDGFANWMLCQAQEELEHSLKFYDFILSRGGRVALAQVDAPPTDWSSPLAVFEATLEHEQKVTGLINDLVELALDAHDHASNIFLQWFVSEQVEEEENVRWWWSIRRIASLGNQHQPTRVNCWINFELTKPVTLIIYIY
jgi:ferritin